VQVDVGHELGDHERSQVADSTHPHSWHSSVIQRRAR
jgi:hypothetical protein